MSNGSKDRSEKKEKSKKREVDENGDPIKVENRDYCNKCKDGGDLLCCDRCPRSFHLKCLGLTEAEIPDGDWFCDKCK